MDDGNGSDNSENLLGQSVDTFGLGLNYRPITNAGDRDPFKNGGGAWAFLSAFYLKY